MHLPPAACGGACALTVTGWPATPQEYVERLPGLSLTISGLGLCSKHQSMVLRHHTTGKKPQHFLTTARSC